MRLIDADAFANMLVDILEITEKAGRTDIARFITDVLTPCVIAFPTVYSVKHGKWNCYYDEDFDSEVIECSKCGERFFAVIDDTEYFMTNYCPNCGAKMDGEPE